MWSWQNFYEKSLSTSSATALVIGSKLWNFSLVQFLDFCTESPIGKNEIPIVGLNIFNNIYFELFGDSNHRYDALFDSIENVFRYLLLFMSICMNNPFFFFHKMNSNVFFWWTICNRLTYDLRTCHKKSHCYGTSKVDLFSPFSENHLLLFIDTAHCANDFPSNWCSRYNSNYDMSCNSHHSSYANTYAVDLLASPCSVDRGTSISIVFQSPILWLDCFSFLQWWYCMCISLIYSTVYVIVQMYLVPTT